MKEQSLKEMKPICSWWDIKCASELGMPISEFEKLLEQYKKNPNDVALLTHIAFVFYLNINLTETDYFYEKDIKGLEEDDCPASFLELAYETKPSIETIHNFAVFMFTWDGEKEYINIQRECIVLNPKSCIPYKWLAWMLLQHMQFDESVHYFQIALEKAEANHETTDEIYDNLATALCNAGRFDEAIKILKTIDDSHRNIYAYYNLAFCYAHLRDKDNYQKMLEKVLNHDYFASVNHRGIADLFFIWGDYETASEHFNKSFNVSSMGRFIDAFTLRMFFAIYQADELKYRELIDNWVLSCSQQINETKEMPDNTHVYDYKSYTVEQLEKTIEMLKGLEKKFQIGKKPIEVAVIDWQKKPVQALDFGCTEAFFINGFS